MKHSLTTPSPPKNKKCLTLLYNYKKDVCPSVQDRQTQKLPERYLRDFQQNVNRKSVSAVQENNSGGFLNIRKRLKIIQFLGRKMDFFKLCLIIRGWGPHQKPSPAFVPTVYILRFAKRTRLQACLRFVTSYTIPFECMLITIYCPHPCLSYFILRNYSISS